MAGLPYSSYSLAELIEEARRLAQLAQAERHGDRTHLAERLALIESYKSTSTQTQQAIGDAWRKLTHPAA